MTESTPPTSNLARAWTWARERGPGFAIEALVNFVAPFLIYDLSKGRLGDVHALMASSAPPIAWSIIEFVRRRRVDALSLLVLGGIALSLLAFAGGGGARFLQLRENLVGGLIALIAIPGVRVLASFIDAVRRGDRLLIFATGTVLTILVSQVVYQSLRSR